MPEKKKMPYVIIRTYSAGVHAGELVSRKGREVILKNSRRIWSWKGAESLSELSVRGAKFPKECRFAIPVKTITLTEAIEIIPCELAAIKMIKECPEWVA
jgi:hypothetical protein